MQPTGKRGLLLLILLIILLVSVWYIAYTNDLQSSHLTCPPNPSHQLLPINGISQNMQSLRKHAAIKWLTKRFSPSCLDPLSPHSGLFCWLVFYVNHRSSRAVNPPLHQCCHPLPPPLLNSVVSSQLFQAYIIWFSALSLILSYPS